MTTDTPPPRRNWHLTRWLIVFIVAMFGWGGWRAYAFRSALAEAKALGWELLYTDPVEAIQGDWKAAFQKETWLDGVIQVIIPTSESFEPHVAIVHRLNPKILNIEEAGTLRDLSALSPLTRLEVVSLISSTALENIDALKSLSAMNEVHLDGCTRLSNVDTLKNLPALQVVRLIDCTGLTNVDALKNLSALQEVGLYGCTGLTNVDVLKNLSALQRVWLTGCTGLTKESVAALKAALPNAQIIGP